MTPPARNLLLLSVLVLGAAMPVHAQKQSGQVYRWVDEDGVVHFGDRVPPEHIKNDREVLNSQGVAVGFEQGEITEEERAAMEREEQREAERNRAQAERARRDRMLLETYLSVEDIENLRDRRLELLESQVKVTQLYLTNLRKRLTDLEKQANRYAPYSEDENAPPMPEGLSGDIARTKKSIDLYEERLSKTREDQQDLRDSFALDIERFRELHGG